MTGSLIINSIFSIVRSYGHYIEIGRSKSRLMDLQWPVPQSLLWHRAYTLVKRTLYLYLLGNQPNEAIASHEFQAYLRHAVECIGDDRSVYHGHTASRRRPSDVSEEPARPHRQPGGNGPGHS